MAIHSLSFTQRNMNGEDNTQNKISNASQSQQSVIRLTALTLDDIRTRAPNETTTERKQPTANTTPSTHSQQNTIANSQAQVPLRNSKHGVMSLARTPQQASTAARSADGSMPPRQLYLNIPTCTTPVTVQAAQSMPALSVPQILQRFQSSPASVGADVQPASGTVGAPLGLQSTSVPNTQTTSWNPNQGQLQSLSAQMNHSPSSNQLPLSAQWQLHLQTQRLQQQLQLLQTTPPASPIQLYPPYPPHPPAPMFQPAATNINQVFYPVLSPHAQAQHFTSTLSAFSTQPFLMPVHTPPQFVPSFPPLTSTPQSITFPRQVARPAIPIEGCSIECGIVVRGIREYKRFVPLFGAEVNVFTCCNDPVRTPLFKGSDLAKAAGITTPRVSMYLLRHEGRSRGCATCGIHQARRFVNRVQGVFTKRQEYFVTEHVAASFLRRTQATR